MMLAAIGCALLLGLVVLPAAAAPAPSVAQPLTDLARPPAGRWMLDPRHASLHVRVRHFGISAFTFRFDGLHGTYDYDPARPLETRVTIAVDPASVNTGIASFDREIAGDAKFFDTGRWPAIGFVSASLELTSLGRGKLAGDLTFRGVTRPVVLDVTYNGYVQTPLGTEIMGFSATGSIERSAFGLRHGVPMISDRVELLIEAEFNPAR